MPEHHRLPGRGQTPERPVRLRRAHHSVTNRAATNQVTTTRSDTKPKGSIGERNTHHPEGSRISTRAAVHRGVRTASHQSHAMTSIRVHRQTKQPAEPPTNHQVSQARTPTGRRGKVRKHRVVAGSTRSRSHRQTTTTPLEKQTLSDAKKKLFTATSTLTKTCGKPVDYRVAPTPPDAESFPEPTGPEAVGRTNATRRANSVNPSRAYNARAGSFDRSTAHDT